MAGLAREWRGVAKGVVGTANCSGRKRGAGGPPMGQLGIEGGPVIALATGAEGFDILYQEEKRDGGLGNRGGRRSGWVGVRAQAASRAGVKSAAPYSAAGATLFMRASLAAPHRDRRRLRRTRPLEVIQP